MNHFNQAILDALTDHIAVINNKGIIIAVNKAWIRFSKENNGDLDNGYLGTNYLDVCQNKVRNGINLILKGKQTEYVFEYSCHYQKKLAWFLLRATPILIDGYYGVVLCHMNITHRKIAELKLAYREKLYKLISKNSSDFVLIHNSRGIYTYASPNSKWIVGYEPSELIAQSNFSFLHPNDRKKLKKINNLSEKSGIQIITFRFRCKNKKYIWLETKYQHIKNYIGKKEIACVSRDVTAQRLKMMKLESEKKLLQRAIYLDELTGVYNRRLFNKLVINNLKKYYKSGCSLLMIDIDYFKQYNDTYGHPQGDQCLKLVAKTLKKSVRKNDFVFRLGGEEFAILLPKTKKVEAITLAKRISSKIEQLKIRHASSFVHPFITISIGGSTIQKDKFTQDDLQTIINQADQALYRAKKSGRNTVSFY